MRYHHFGVLSGRRFFGTLLILLILPVALQSCGKILWKRPVVVSENVSLQSTPFGGLTKEEAAVVLTRLAGEVRVAAEDARIDPSSGSVIPDLSGVAMDVDSTLARLIAAGPGSAVEPVYTELPAHTKLSDYPLHPLYQGHGEKPQVTFLINVAWGNEYLPEMLDVLKEAGAGATFFLVGRWVRGNPELAGAIREAGFELANHGDSDALSMEGASFPQALEDIKKANDTIEEICGVRPVYFSPHRGELTDTVVRAAAEEGCRTVMWTVDTVDWTLPGVDAMVDKIMGNAVGGSLILMHPTEQTAEFMRQVIPLLRKKGLEPVTLTELLSPARVETDVTTVE